jgi:hypothetical protein
MTLEKPISTTSQECQVTQQQHVSPKPVTREWFLNERRPAHLITSPLPTHQSHQLKTHIKLPTPKDMLSV